MNLQQTIEAARNVIRFRQMSYRTEKAYVGWITRYAHWCREHQEGSHTDKVRAFLTHLARDRTSQSAARQASPARLSS